MTKHEREGGNETHLNNKRMNLEDKEDVGEVEGNGKDEVEEEHGASQEIERRLKDGNLMVQEQNTLFNRVPSEVWEMIFGHLGKPEEVHKAMNTCAKWHGALASKRTRVLFPLVLPQLLQYLKPTITTVLSLRQVCKSWKQTIDTLVQNYSTDPEKFEELWGLRKNAFQPIIKHLEGAYCLGVDSSRQIDSMTELLSTYKTHQNPFVSRTVTIKFESGDNFRPSYDTAANFLQKYGHHIWHFNHASPVLGNGDNLVTTLPTLLSHLPNVRTLQLVWGSLEGNAGISHETLELIRTTQGQNFPELPRLTSLAYSFSDGGGLRSLLGVALLHRYGPQLQTLVCQGDFLGSTTLSQELFRELLPNLKNLRVVGISSGALHKLSQLRNFPLERLQLSYNYNSLPFICVGKAIESFSSTLVHLLLDVKTNNYPCQEWRSQVHSSKLNDYNPGSSDEVYEPFPKLTNLAANVNDVNSRWFWDLVKVQFKGLKRLDFRVAVELYLPRPFQRKFIAGEMEKSRRFFDVLPKLEKIHFWLPNDNCLVIRRKTKS